MPKFILLIVLLVATISLAAQTQRAESLRPNVVAITAAGQQGFGFITGSRHDKLFVVTAAHVVQDINAESSSIELKFYDDYKRYTAQVIHNYFPEQDIALLEVSKPEYFSWSNVCLGQAKIGADVGFIGRKGNWYVPRGHAIGTINSFEQDQVVVDITSVTVGTSGAPLIAESGIVGMIINADDVEVRAIKISQLRTTLAEEYSYFFTLTSADKTSNESSTEKQSVRKNLEQIQDRQGHTYTTKVLKDNRRWMRQNLNLKVDNSWCYKDNPANCARYGRLYTWEAAKQACAELGDDWRLPTDEEWREMTKQYGGSDDDASDGGKAAYRALLVGGSSGFAAQLGGWRHPDKGFYNYGGGGLYWSSSSEGSTNAWGYYFYSDHAKLYRLEIDHNDGRSVRCIQK